MICRKCGAILPDNAIRCSNCGIKVNMVCPECKTLNPFGTKHCKKCGFELIKTCPECNCSNIYSASECRKCKTPFLKKEQNSIELDIVRPISCSSPSNYTPGLDEQIVTPLHQDEQTEINPVEKTTEIEKIFNENFEQPAAVPDTKETIQETNINTDEVIQQPEIIDTTVITEDTEDTNVQEKDITEEEPAALLTEESKEEIVQTILQEESPKEISQEETKQKTEEELIEKNPEEPSEPQTLQLESVPDIQKNEIPVHEELINNIEIQPLEETADTDVQDSLNDFIQEEPREDEDEYNEIEEHEEFNFNKIEIRQEAVKKAFHIIKNSIEKHIIAINGPEGCGKSAVIKQTSEILTNQGYISLYGNCTPLSQITSFGFFQDAFLRMMGFPPYTNSSEAFVKDFKKSDFVNAFNFLHGQELSLFLNMFYPVQKDNFENILENKQLMFSILEKVIKSFLVSSNVIITIDNFELLDGASYDFIMYLLSKNFFNNRLKLLVAYQENKSIQSYFDITAVDDKIFETIYLQKFNKEELLTAVNNAISLHLEEILPSKYLDEIIQKTDGNAIRLEQEAAFLWDIKYIHIKNNEIILNEENKPAITPQSMEELIKLRINTLPPSARNVLFMAAIMGYRFATGILCLSVAMPVKKAETLLNFLKQELFISFVDNFTCEFKNLTIWKLVYQEAKADLLFKENSERLYLTLRPLILSSNIQKLISCTEALNKNEEFLIWQETANITAKLGDTNLYVIAQKQCLKLIEESNIPNSEQVRSIIYEQIGKLLSNKSPSESVTYLANVLDAEIKADNINKVVDLSGYFINSCYLTGNYFGAAEAVDAIISSLTENTENPVSQIDLALIKTRKLKALLNIGNSEQIINLVQEEILPELNRELSIKQPDTSYKNLLIDAWLLSNTILAKAFALQGNSEVYQIIEEIRENLEKYGYKTAYYITQTDLIEAFANTTTGNISQSNNILTNITNRYKTSTMECRLLSEWNLVNIINRLLAKQNDGLKADLFELAAFTNNINEHFMKNIIKLILGYVLKEEGNTPKALTIFNEEITYFAKEKVATGALLSWALIVQISIDTGDLDKALNTATKALEIAQSPKINNFFFIIWFQQFIAEIYLLQGDLIAVKMYLEKAIMLAKQQNLKYQQVDLYIDYGKYMEEYMNAKQMYTEEYLKLTTDMYNKAVLIAKELKLSPLIEKSTKERSAFRTYCQLNSIEI